MRHQYYCTTCAMYIDVIDKSLKMREKKENTKIEDMFDMNLNFNYFEDCLHWRTQRGGLVRFNPPLNLQNFLLCICKTYSPSPALMFIKSKILYRKTLEIVR